MFGSIKRGDLVQPDDVKADADLRVQIAELEVRSLVLRLLDQFQENGESGATEVLDVFHIDQKLLRPVLTGDERQFGSELLCLKRKPQFLGQDFHERNLADHAGGDVLKIDGGHGGDPARYPEG